MNIVLGFCLCLRFSLAGAFTAPIARWSSAVTVETASGSWLGSSLLSSTSSELEFNQEENSETIGTTTMEQGAPRLKQSTSSSSTTTHSTTSQTTLTKLQQESAAIASTFRLKENFDPWLREGHSQSIVGFFLRDHCSYVPSTLPEALSYTVSRIAEQILEKKCNVDDKFWDVRERIETPDGDWFHADTKFAVPPSSSSSSSETDYEGNGLGSNAREEEDPPIVILLHGLQSSSDSSLSRNMAQAYVQRGLTVVCLNFRGCSGESNAKLGGYHLGFTDDLKYYLDLLKERYNKATTSRSSSSLPPPIYLSGFSLGSNVVLKCLGELEERAILDYNIQGAAVLCAPLENELNSLVLGRPFSIQRFIYTRNLLSSLQAKAIEQWEQFCQIDDDATQKAPFDLEGVLNAKTISDFDTAFIAKVYGFKDCWDYYEQTSSGNFLERIAVPTMILNAKDDPFFDPNAWPVEKSFENGGIAPVKMIRVDHGGHLGFSFHKVKDTDRRLCQGETTTKQVGWASTECSRFLTHVQRRLFLDSEH